MGDGAKTLQKNALFVDRRLKSAPHFDHSKQRPGFSGGKIGMLALKTVRLLPDEIGEGDVVERTGLAYVSHRFANSGRALSKPARMSRFTREGGLKLVP